VEIRLLGVVEIVDDADSAAVVRGEHLRALLVALALRCGKPVSTDRLIETLWGDDPPEGSANALQRHVSALRRVLGAPELVVRRGPGYVLDVEPTAVDALRFRALVREGREAMAAGDAKAAGALLADALCLWRGDAFADSALTGYAATDAAQLDEDRLAAIEARIDADLALGRQAELVAELEGLVARHPFREHFVAQLMLALARSGRQAEALRAYQSARVVLGEELGLEPSDELRAIETAILTQDSTLTGSAAMRVVRAHTNLRSPLTSLVGRGGEVDALTALVSAQRLVTLVGSGGAGKTRLAIEVARRWLESSDSEVWVVELAEVGDEAGVVPAIEAAVNLPDDADFSAASGPRRTITGRLATFLEDRQTLLLLDNCEHLVAEVARIAQELLESCPSLRVIATSREGLGVTGEVLRQVPPLPLEDAMVLFTERACAVAPWLDREALIHGDGRRRLVDVCTKLDGLPLAVELAAARLSAMPMDELAARLDDRFRLLTRGSRTALPRQRTLRAVVDWSYDLLSKDERRVFERLSVFNGGCAPDAAGAVCGGGHITVDDVLELLTRLADKSLIVMENRDGRLRYRMLQTLVHYGRDRLGASGDAERTYAAHLRYFAALCGRSDAALRGTDQRGWLAAVAAELDNIRSALGAAIAAGDAETAEGIAGSLGWYWWVSGRPGEGYRWLSAARACPGPAEPATRARLLAWTAYLSNAPEARADDGVTAASTDSLLDDAIALFRRADALDELATIEAILAMMYSTRGTHRRMRDLMSDAERLFAQVDATPWNVAMRAWVAARRAFYEGRYDEAEGAVVACNKLLMMAGDEFVASFNAMYLGRLALLRGDHDGCHRALERGILLARGLGLAGLVNHLTTDLGDAVALGGDPNRAREILDMALTSGRDLVWLPGTGQALTALAWLERRAGNHDEAVTRANEALTMVLAADNRIGIAQCLALLGHLDEEAGDLVGARNRHQQSLERAMETGDPRARALALEGLASVALHEGDGVAAARHLGAAHALRRTTTWQTGWPLASALRGDTERITDGVIELLGAEAFAAEYERGGAAIPGALGPGIDA
jgi:predicted ATPase/DNA-binding SARP family transcriptional activator